MNADDVLHLFRAIDDHNADAFVSFFTPNGSFRFANAPIVSGHRAVHEAVTAFFASIASCRHTLRRIWNDGDHVAVYGDVTYIRKDQRQVTVPFVNVFEMHDDKIDAYLVHVDVTPVYA